MVSKRAAKYLIRVLIRHHQRSVNVGTASEDPNASATIGAALATGDEGTIYAAVAQFTAAAAATPEQPAENQSAEEQAIVGDGQVDVSGDNGGNGQ